MEEYKSKSEARTILMRKLMTICPICGKLIFGRDIDFACLDKSKVNRWPMSYIHNHSHKEFPEHSLTLYIDANFSVRDKKVSNLIEIQK